MKKPEKKCPVEPMDWKQNVVLYMHDLLYMLIASLVIFLVFFRVIVVSGSSMYDTLIDGDYLLLVGNQFYRNPAYGDIIVSSKESFDDGSPIIKRVIATEGQTVDIDFDAGIVYVDEIPLNEPYTFTGTNIAEGMQFPLIVEEGCLFLMGDNRNESLDSRNPKIGLVDTREILGKAIWLFVPGDGTADHPIQRDFGRIGGLNNG